MLCGPASTAWDEILLLLFRFDRQLDRAFLESCVVRTYRARPDPSDEADARPAGDEDILNDPAAEHVGCHP